MRDIFISKPQLGCVYVAERSRKGYRKFRWSIGRAEIPSGPDIRIEVSIVPYKIRRQAYRRLDLNRGETSVRNLV
jgi:hypothetical protein